MTETIALKNTKDTSFHVQGQMRGAHGIVVSKIEKHRFEHCLR